MVRVAIPSNQVIPFGPNMRPRAKTDTNQAVAIPSNQVIPFGPHPLKPTMIIDAFKQKKRATGFPNPIS